MMIGLLLIGVFAFASQENTTEEIDKRWILTGQTIDEIYMAGMNQPVNLVIERSEKRNTEVIVTGKVPERSLKSLSDKQYTKQSDTFLNLAFEELKTGLGTHHININENARKPVTIKVSLGKETILKTLHLDSTGGAVHLQLPKDFQANYHLTAVDGEVKNTPQSVNGAQTNIKVTNYYANIIVD